ncbi:MAG: OmpA family protein [Deltaproteobacteria bacterium]|nr:OmpA family protein [Deltaproteobacteria bacterium]
MLLGALAVGCVTQGSHREIVAERDQLLAEKMRLEERVRRLEASSESLGAERVALLEELDDLHEAQASLETDVRRLRKAEAELSETLAVRSAEFESRGEEVGRLRETYEGLVADLEGEVATGQIEIQQLREGLRLNLTQEVLFSSGSAEVNAGGRIVLTKVAERVRGIPHEVEVQGHTDNMPIHSERYPTNWELAGARASRVVRFLEEQGVAPDRLCAISHGEYVPVAPNDSDAGRAKNRRIEITLKPVTAVAAAGAQGEQTPAAEDTAAEDGTQAASPATP